MKEASPLPDRVVTELPPRRLARSGIAQTFYGLGLAVLVLAVAYVGRGIFIPFIMAGFLSFLIYTLKQTIKHAPGVGRFLPDWFCYIAAFGLIISITIFFIEIIGSNVEALISAWPAYEARLREISQSGVMYIKGFEFVPDEFSGGIDELRRRALGAIAPVLREMGSSMRAITASLVTVFLYTVFMLLERGRLFRKINLLSPAGPQRDAVNQTINDVGSMVRQYIAVKTATNLITATISYALMRLIGIDFAGFWALLIFVLNYIPIVGAISAITLPVLLALVQPDGGGLRTALLTLGLLVGAEQAMSSGIEPRLIGRTLNLSPLVILLSLAVWGTMWGFVGALLAVPITVTVMIILTQFQATRPLAILLSDNGDIAPINHARLTRARLAKA